MQLETERLKLRPLSKADEAEVAELPFTRPTIREAALAQVRAGASEREWDERGHGPFAVLERGTGRFVGRAGLMYRPQFDEIELSWILRQDAQGYGYATEAAAAIIDWAFPTLGLRYITAMIRPDNAPSIRVAERLGLTPLRSEKHLDEQLVVYHLRREAGPAAPGKAPAR